MSDYNPTAELVGEGVLSGELVMTQGALHNEFVGEGVMRGWLRQNHGMFRGTFSDEADLPTIARVKGDFADITPADGSHPYSVVWDGASSWVPSYTTKQGPIIASPEPVNSVAYFGAMKPQMGDSVYPFRIWNEVDTSVANQPFHVDASGNIRLAGGIQASSIDIPAASSVGFHVNSSGGVSVGGTTAVGIGAGDLDVDGDLTLTGGGQFLSSTAPPRLTISGSNGSLFFQPSSLGGITAGSLSSTRVGGSPAYSALLMLGPSGISGTRPALWWESYDSDAKPHSISVYAGALRLSGDSSQTTGAFFELQEMSAPSTPLSNYLRIYAKDKSGISTPYYKDDGGTEHVWLASTDVLMQTTAAAKGDLVVADADDSWVRLAVGSDGQMLAADSTAAKGVNWVTPAPKDADYLVGTAHSALSNEIVVGTTPGGQLGGTWASPTVDESHASSAHRDLAITVGAANVAAGIGTPSNMVHVGQGGSTSAGRFVMPWAGSIVGISVSSNEARAAGSCTVEIYKNNAATGVSAVLNATNTTHTSTTQATGVDTFVAGDYLEIRISTTAGWLPITADVIAQGWVVWSS